MPASTLLVPVAPPTQAARAALRPPSGPWARRRPNSITSAPAAAWQIRAALVATSVWKLRVLSNSVSTSWVSASVPVTVSSGSLANTRVPSGGATTVPRKRKSRRKAMNGSSNRPIPAR